MGKSNEIARCSIYSPRTIRGDNHRVPFQRSSGCSSRSESRAILHPIDPNRVASVCVCSLRCCVFRGFRPNQKSTICCLSVDAFRASSGNPVTECSLRKSCLQVERADTCSVRRTAQREIRRTALEIPRVMFAPPRVAPPLKSRTWRAGP